jgi:hypothetical protein
MPTPRPHSRSSRVKRVLAHAVDVAVWLAIALLLGIPAALVQLGLRGMTEMLAASTLMGNPGPAAVFDGGIRIALALTIMLLTAFAVFALWRTVSGPQRLRVIAYGAIQLWAIAVALIPPGTEVGVQVAWYLAGVAGAGWWSWQKRWRGAGVAPSPLAGVLRPDTHTGQIWYGVVNGSQETKVRPVMVLARAPERQWLVAYFTSREPRPHLAKYYLSVPAGTLRGMDRDNWVSLRDPRTLSRGQLRSYTGLAPRWVYEQVCTLTGTVADPHALTVDEQVAGSGHGPVEHLLRTAFTGTPPDPEVTEAMSVSLRAFLKFRVAPWRRPRQGK